MNSSLLRMLAFITLWVGAARSSFGQTEDSSLPAAKAERPASLSLEDAAIQSRVALYSDTTKGQCHAKEKRQFEAVANRFIAALSARNSKDLHAEFTIPFFFEEEQILDQAAVTDRLAEIIFPGVFAKADSKRILLLDTLQQMEQLLEQRVPAKARDKWVKHTAHPSRIAVVSGGPVIVGLSLRKTDKKYSVSGLLFAYFPKQDAKILKAVNEGLLDQQ